MSFRERDGRRLLSLLRGKDRLVREIDARAPAWTAEEPAILPAPERRAALVVLDRLLDHHLAFDALAAAHLPSFWRTDILGEDDEHAVRFLLGTGAYLGRLALGLELVSRTLRHGRIERLLDEGSAELGIPAGAYGRLRDDVIGADHVARVAAAGQYHDLLRGSRYPIVFADGRLERIASAIDELHEHLTTRLLQEGPRLVLGGALEVLRGVARWAFFPIQAEVAEWMGDTRIVRDGSLIHPEQIAEAARQCRPGDLLVERRNWYLSNIGLPGFWPHSAMWIGTSADLARHLDADPEILSAYGGPFTAALRERAPAAFAALETPGEEGHPRVVLEAVSEGVILASAEHSLAADYAAALRPRRSALEVARAIERGFEMFGRPYDFDFDFVTDAAVVCSELVYKAWEPREGVTGLRFDLEEILGRPTLSPNRMVAAFDESFGTPEQQLDFVWFLDGSEEKRTASFADISAFRPSHRRPKWDFAQK